VSRILIIGVLLAAGLALWIAPSERTLAPSVEGGTVTARGNCELPIVDVFSTGDSTRWYGYSQTENRIEDPLPCRPAAWWRVGAGVLAFVAAAVVWRRSRKASAAV
jgi:hypothetical protein